MESTRFAPPIRFRLGARGSGPIPPNAILVFNVEVVSAQ